MKRHRLAVAGAAALLTLGVTACGGDESAAQADAGTGQSEMAGMDHSGMAGMDHSGMAGMDHSAMAAAMAAAGDGTKAEVDGYALTALSAPKQAGRSDELSFRIMGPAGKVQKDFVRELGKLMHVYVVREDLTQYQHIHPELDGTTGTWSVPLALTEPGPYRVVVEFEALTQAGEFADRRLGEKFTVAGKYTPVPFAGSFAEGSAEDYLVTITGAPRVHGDPLTLTITRDGQGVTELQQYLESFAHITGFRRGDLKAVHVHPNETPPENDPAATGGPTLTINSHFQEPGTYRMFVQFQTDGEVHTLPVDLKVTT